jgi:hypothetical protein
LTKRAITIHRTLKISLYRDRGQNPSLAKRAF